MKPLQLEFENFGPYRKETIRFDTFEDYPLFLISGKTGSGKTTIFDGMCYALYGETTGGARQAKEMRSNFAEDTEKTSVTLVFEHLGNRYEITREPDQILEKKNGKGTTNKKSKVSFIRYDKEGNPLSELTKVNEVKQKIEDLLHLNAQQFTQIILLPQGEFRKFLNASSDEKERVLRRLFGTQLYSEVSRRLKELKGEKNNQLVDEEKKINLLFEQVNFEEEYQEEFQSKTALEERLAVVDEQNAQFDWKREALQKKLEELKKLKLTVDKKQQEQEQLLKEFKQREDLLAEMMQLNSQKITMDQTRAVVERLKWLDKWQPILVQIKKETADVEEITQQINNAIKKSTEILTTLNKEKEKQATLTSQTLEMDGKRLKIQELEKALPLIKDYQNLELEQKEFLKKIETTEQVITEINTFISKSQTTLEKNLGTLSLESTWLKEKASHEKKAQQLTQLAKDYHGYYLDVLTLEKMNTQKNELQEKLQGHDKKVELAKNAYLKGKSDVAGMQIARLSLDLLPGEPCMVCGSLEHPSPYEAKEWSIQSIQAAEQDLIMLEENYVDAQKEQASQRESLKQLIKQQETLAEKTNSIRQELVAQGQVVAWTHEVAKESEAISSELTYIEQAQKEVELLVEEKSQQLLKVEALKQEQAVLMNTLEEKRDLLAEYQETQRINNEELKGLVGQQEQLVKLLPTDWATGDYSARLKTLQAQLTDWETASKQSEEVLTRLKNEQLVQENTRDHLEKQLSKQEKSLLEQQMFMTEKIKDSLYTESIERFTEDLSDIGELAKLEQQVLAFDDTLKRLTILLEEKDSLLKNKEQPDLAIVTQEQQDLQRDIEEKARVISIIEQGVNHNKQIYQKIVAQYESVKQEMKKLGELSILSDVANGDRPYKLSFERYVLQVYFTETLKVANEKLQLLTNKRYSFELDESVGSYRKTTGLELNIYDDNVGSVRSVNTLSGGESFIAALSLSLALGEVVQAQAGGVRIDAMFIDEGFGSLDEESLEMAIESLELVESKGRMIGIISHVRELKQRIPQQIQVIAKGTGESSVAYQLIKE